MRLSKLQKYIILKCFEKKNITEQKTEFYNYYPKKELKENKLIVQVAIQKSIENLIAKGLVIAFGYKTAKKLYVNKVKLTAKGKSLAKEIIKNRQRKLPIK